MNPIVHEARQLSPRLRTLGLTILALSLLAACSSAPTQTPETEAREAPAPSATALPTETTQSSPTPEPLTLTATDTSVSETPSHTPTGRPTVTPTPTSTAPQHLVLAKDGHVLYGDLRGQDLQEIAQIDLSESWDMVAGRIALAQGSLLQVVDLVQGTNWTHQTSQDSIIHTEVLWGIEGRALLECRTIDEEAQRQLVLQAIDSTTGKVIGTRAMADGATAIPLLYDDGNNEIYVARLGDTGELAEVQILPLSGSDETISYPIQGQMPVSLHKDGQRFVYVAQSTNSLCMHQLGKERPDQCLELPDGQAPTSYAWASTGDQLAVMLQPDPNAPSADSSAAGLWVIPWSDDAIMEQVLAHAGPMSAVMGWSPDDEMILARHSGGNIPDHIYLIRPNGGDRRILPGSEKIIPLGWMPARSPDASEVALDPWMMRFARIGSDSEALADATAQWLASTQNKDDDALAELLHEYVLASGSQIGLASPDIVQVKDNLYAIQLPPHGIYVCEAGMAHHIGAGHLIQDVRYDNNLLAVVHATIGASSLTPSMTLAERTDDAWRVTWTPQGQQHWIVTDGEIRFADQGLDRVIVRGSTFGLEPAKADAFRECHACLHRWLETEWTRTDGSYALVNEGITSMSRESALWTLTERTPYAILHEAIRRMRLEQDTSELASVEAQTQLNDLNLLDPQRLLQGEQETTDTVLFSDLESGTRYQARISQGKLVSVTRIAS